MSSTLKIAILAGAAGTVMGYSAPAHAASMRFDCDSLDGAYSEVVQTQNGPAYGLKAEITAKRLGRHRDWWPNALIEIRSADGKSAIGVQFRASSYQNRTVSVMLITTSGGEKKEYSVATVKLDEAVNAAIAVRDGKVRADVAGEFAEAPISVGSGAEVRVACSTGEFMFERLEMTAAD
jgi:hypothetical protein